MILYTLYINHSYTGAATVHGVLTTSKESTGSGKFGLSLVFLMFLDLTEMPPHSNSTSGEVTCSSWKRFMSRTPQHSTCGGRGGGGGGGGGGGEGGGGRGEGGGGRGEGGGGGKRAHIVTYCLF